MTELRTGEPGHVWEHASKRKWPPRVLLADGEPQRVVPGPLVCTNADCGVLWPGTEPCTAAPKS